MSKLVFIFILLISNMAKAEFFSNISNIIENNNNRLSYGISVTDFDKDGNYEFIIAGFGYSNLALSYKNGKLLIQYKILYSLMKRGVPLAYQLAILIRMVLKKFIS